MAATKYLSKAQNRVMTLLSRRWTAETVGGSIHINGKRVCNIDTMTVLVRLGLIAKDSQWIWKATASGLAWTA